MRLPLPHDIGIKHHRRNNEAGAVVSPQAIGFPSEGSTNG